MNLNFIASCLSVCVLISTISAATVIPESPSDTESSENEVVDESSDDEVINVEHIESNTWYIELKWNFTGEVEAESFRISAMRVDNDVVINSPAVKEQYYKMEDLRTHTEYDICVTAMFTDGSEEITECEKMSTVPTMMESSVVALVVLFVGILVIILISYCLALKKRKDYEATLVEEADEEADKDDALANGDPNAPFADDKSPSSIEEAHEIPYITPPEKRKTGNYAYYLDGSKW